MGNAVAAVREVDRPSRSSLKNVYRTYAELIVLGIAGARLANIPGAAFNRREKPSEQALFGECLGKMIPNWSRHPCNTHQTLMQKMIPKLLQRETRNNNFTRIGSNTSLAGSGGQDLAARIQ